MLRASLFKGLCCSLAPLSAKMSDKRLIWSGALAEKVAVITGSTKGIGFAIARRLAQDGAHVVISSRKQQNVNQAVATLQREGLSVTGTVCHVGKAEDREQLVSKLGCSPHAIISTAPHSPCPSWRPSLQALEHSGGVDFLVCNAAVNPLVGSILGTSEQVWDKILDVNVKSPALLLSQMLPHMEKRGKGAVILVSSVSAYLPVVLHKNELTRNIVKALSMQRVGQPEDCAGLASFLCSPDASYITGENIVVAGFSPRL